MESPDLGFEKSFKNLGVDACPFIDMWYNLNGEISFVI